MKVVNVPSNIPSFIKVVIVNLSEPLAEQIVCFLSFRVAFLDRKRGATDHKFVCRSKLVHLAQSSGVGINLSNLGRLVSFRSFEKVFLALLCCRLSVVCSQRVGLVFHVEKVFVFALGSIIR